jgi:hypothetical protein
MNAPTDANTQSETQPLPITPSPAVTVLSAGGLTIQPPPPPAKLKPITQVEVLVGTLEVMSEADRVDFQNCEAAILKGWHSQIEVGLALARIKKKGYFQDDYPSFEVYCHVRWGLHRSKAVSLMSAARVSGVLAELSEYPQPDHEYQLRPLYGLLPEQAKLAWQFAAGRSGGRPVTASMVKRALKELQLSPQPAEAKPKRINKAAQRQVINEGVRELLMLAVQRKPHETLIAKIESLHHQIQLLFAPAKASKEPMD